MVVSINIGTLENRVMIDVYGNYYPAHPGSREDPPEDEQFEISMVKYNEVCIDPILDILNFDWYELEQKCLNEIKN